MRIKVFQFVINNRWFINIWLVFLLGLPAICFAQSKTAIVKEPLHAVSQKILIDNYDIAEVTDERVVKDSEHLYATTSKTQPTSAIANVASALKNYLSEHYAFSSTGKRIRLDIKELAFNENISAAKEVIGKLKINFSFDVIKGDDIYAHLTDYKWTLSYTRMPTAGANVNRYIFTGLKNAIKFFDVWYDRNKNTNSLLAKAVKLTFKDYAEMPEGDTIYYASGRPLTWADFKAKPEEGRFAAEVIPGFGFAENNNIRDGILNVEIALKAYLPKSAAWVKRGEENEAVLNHEQRHFDIAKLIAERFKKKMLKEDLPVYNYDGYINVAYFDSLRELTDMQKQYDAETTHGINTYAQNKWDKKIDEELRLHN